MLKKLTFLTISIMGLISLLLVNTACSEEPPMPVDSTAFNRVYDIIYNMEGADSADAFRNSTDPSKVILIEDTIYLVGSTSQFVNDSVIEQHNQILKGLGQIYARALRTGYCTPISAMKFWTGEDPPVSLSMSSPTRTAGGRGTTDYVTVQSSYTNSGSGFKICFGTDLFAGTRQIAKQTESFLIPAGDTYTCNWTIKVICSYTAAIKYDMAKGISPEAGYGGTIYPLSQGKFTYGAGTQTVGAKKYTGGDGNVQDLLIEYQISWGAGAPDTVTRFDVLNSNSAIAHSATGLSVDMDAGDILKAFHHATFIGL